MERLIDCGTQQLREDVELHLNAILCLLHCNKNLQGRVKLPTGGMPQGEPASARANLERGQQIR